MKTAIVIGGGIAGCSTAFALAQRGIAVTLIERHEYLAQEASGNPIAMLYPKFGARPNASSTLALQGFEFTLDLLNQLPEKDKIFEACGLIQLAFNAREQAHQQALLQNKRLNFLHHLDMTSASEIAGITLKSGGLFFQQAGWIKPQVLCEALCSDALITKMTSTEALSIKKNMTQWLVNHTFVADFVVMCNANDIQRFAQYKSAKITPVRGQINFFATNKVSQNIKTIICSNHFVSPAVDGTHAIGTTYKPNDMNPHLSESDTHENLNALRAISPEIFKPINIKNMHGRVAWRSQTPDYMPMAGQLIDEEKLCSKPPRYNANPADLPWLNGLYVNAGHGSKGMITAPICGEFIANLAINNTLPLDVKLASRLNPSRFLLRELGLKQLANSLYQ